MSWSTLVRTIFYRPLPPGDRRPVRSVAGAACARTGPHCRGRVVKTAFRRKLVSSQIHMFIISTPPTTELFHAFTTLMLFTGFLNRGFW